MQNETMERLETICRDVEKDFKRDKDVDLGLILSLNQADEMSLGHEVYKEFATEYLSLLEKSAKKGKKKEPKANIDLEAIGWNSFYGALLGSLFQPRPYATIGGAVAGLTLTLYEQIARKDLDLGSVFWGVLGGGIVGSFMSTPEMPYFSYIGAAVGGLIAIGKGIYESSHKDTSAKKEEEFQEKKEELLRSAYKKLNDKIHYTMQQRLESSAAEPEDAPLKKEKTAISS